MSRIPYVCPQTREALRHTPEGMVRPDGKRYPYLPTASGAVSPVPDFLGTGASGEGQGTSLSMYNAEAACEMYRNFLDWLFATFEADETAFRKAMAARLRLSPGQSALVTGCGLGDDIPAILDEVGADGEVYAQDLSAAMAFRAAALWADEPPEKACRVSFSVGNALWLPFADDVFDAAFHFGGINLFDDIARGIDEMNRVVKPGGRVVFGDEGVGPWLRDTDYSRMVITNNGLWARQAPIDKLPATAADVALSWVLGNCFWVCEYTVASALPECNPHVRHKGPRGGSMWTRYHGQIEGVTPETRTEVREAAAKAGMSVHDWLEGVLQKGLQPKPSGDGADG